MAPLRILFMGTAELSRVSLRGLLNSPEMAVIAVVTQPDRPKGREMKLQPSPVKETALASNLPVLQPEKARSEIFVEEIRALRPDLIAVAAYGQILPESLLEVPRHGCVNVHTSLLPRYRGAAPIQWAILNGDAETGVTIMKIDATLDTGDILSQSRTRIEPWDTAETLHDRLAQMGAELLVRTVPDYVAGKIIPQPQSAEGAVYAPKIKKEDGRINWQLPAGVIRNRVRGLAPWPGAFSFLPKSPHPQLIKFWQAELTGDSGTAGEVLQVSKAGIVVGCGQGALRILELQLEGGRRLSAQEFLAGHTLPPGARLV